MHAHAMSRSAVYSDVGASNRNESLKEKGGKDVRNMRFMLIHVSVRAQG